MMHNVNNKQVKRFVASYAVNPGENSYKPHMLENHTSLASFLLLTRMPICQNQLQGLFKDFQRPYEGYIRRTKSANQHFYKHIISLQMYYQN